ncbi:MAG: hypothetical protein RLZZ69_1721, partial [Cyanobacteriota bacterium]
MSHTIGQVKQDTQQSNSNSNQPHQDGLKPEAELLGQISGLSDADYEFLFNQLLEGIAHGWHDRRIIKFFNQLGDRGQQADWVIWLERYRIKLLKLPSQSKRQWGTMIIRLGELTQSANEIKQISAAAHRIGRELLFDNNPAVIWEYAGPDFSLNEQIETEQELSQRLPNDFNALGAQSTAEVESDLAVESASLEDDNFDAQPQSNLWLENIDSVASDSAKNEIQDNIDNPLDSPATASLEDNFSLTSSAEIIESSDANLDLDLELDSSHQINRDGEELELKSEPELESPLLDDSSLEVIESWFNLGLKQVSAGEYAQAIVSWDKALKINANLPEAWHNRGSALGRMGDYEAALAKLNLSQRQVPIVVKLDTAARKDLDVLGRLMVPGVKGPVMLSQVATLEMSGGPAVVTRMNRVRNVNFDVELSGVPLGEVTEAVTKLPSIVNLPAGVQQVEVGDAEMQGEMAAGFGLAMLTGVLCIYIVLVLLFKDFLHPVSILPSVILSFGGAFLGLLIANKMLSMPSFIGLIMLMGVATKKSVPARALSCIYFLPGSVAGCLARA